MLIKTNDGLRYFEREVSSYKTTDMKTSLLDEVFENVLFMSLNKDTNILEKTNAETPEEFILDNIEYNKDVFASLDDNQILDYYQSIYSEQDTNYVVLPVCEIKTKTIQLAVDKGQLKNMIDLLDMAGLIAGTKDEIDYAINRFNAISNNENIAIIEYPVDYCTHCGRFDVDFENGEYFIDSLPYEGNLSDEAEIKDIINKYLRDVEVL